MCGDLVGGSCTDVLVGPSVYGVSLIIHLCLHRDKDSKNMKCKYTLY